MSREKLISILCRSMIFVASSNAEEVAVLKQQSDSNRWCQWTLEDSARITLPMSSVNDTFPVGIAVDYCSPIQYPKGIKSICKITELFSFVLDNVGR